MAREIKFRAWNVKEKLMISGHDLAFEIYAPLCELLKDNGTMKYMQYTGLHDKNGKEIYEGDIFKFDDEQWWESNTESGYDCDSWEVKNYGAVGFDEDTGRYDFIKYKYNENQIEADLHENQDLEFAEFVSELEVIGNVYENPELLQNN